MKIQPIATSFTAAVLALTCALVLGAVVFSQSRAFRDSFERMAERDAQKRKLDEASRMEQFRREFVENVSHESKTPLAGVVGAVEMLVDGKLGTWATHIETVRGIGYRLDR